MASQEQTKFSASDVELKASAWMDDPYTYFSYSNTRIHSVPREEAEAVQLAALNLRLEQRRHQIHVLDKLASAQDIRRVESLNDGAALLFEHTAYKSYPVSLLAKSRFDQLTTWLSRLTTHDLGSVDVSNCSSIDDWLTTIQEQTPLDPATSSGTTGTMSFFPKSKKDYLLSAKSIRVQLLQAYGSEPTDSDITQKFHVMTPLFRDGHSSTGAFAKYLNDVFAFSDERYLHTAFPFKVSADLLWLGARLRSAAAKGAIARLDVPRELAERREELEALQKDMPSQQSQFIREVAEKLKGERVMALGLTNMFYEVAKKGIAEGVAGLLGPDSVLMCGGGAKGMVLPDGYEKTILEFTGVSRMVKSYGMTEVNTFFLTCNEGNYHIPPWVTLFILDPLSGQPVPRQGLQSGRASYFDMTNDGTWGGVVSGDKVTVNWDETCSCGRASHYIIGEIERFSDLEGGEDKITCAATPGAQQEAIDYLTSL